MGDKGSSLVIANKRHMFVSPLYVGIRLQAAPAEQTKTAADERTSEIFLNAAVMPGIFR
jgi:hypothetical protein